MTFGLDLPGCVHWIMSSMPITSQELEKLLDEVERLKGSRKRGLGRTLQEFRCLLKGTAGIGKFPLSLFVHLR